MKRLLRTDKWLWAILILSFGVTRAVVSYWITPNHSWLVRFEQWMNRGFDDFDFVAFGLYVDGVIRLIPVAAIAWLVQAIFVRLGVNLVRRPLPAAAADYDDALVPRPLGS